MTEWKCYADGPYVVTEWSGQIAKKLCKPKNVGRSNETTAEQQAEKEAAAKRAKRAKKEGRTIKPMLAHPYKESKAVFPCHVQPKLDGVRCLAYWADGDIVLQSRGGDPYDVEHVKEALRPVLPPGAVLDGELYIHGMPLQNIVSLVKRPQEGSAALQYWVYDTVAIHDRFEGRWWRAEQIARGFLGDVVHLVLTQICSDPAALAVFEHHCLSAGYEGVIVRASQNFGYVCGKRTWGLMKLKRWQDAEFEIVGWKFGEGKYEGVPVLRCVTEAGVEFDCNPPGDMAERNALGTDPDALVGQQLTVRYFTLTNAGVPQFPVGICIREPGT